MQFLFVHNNFPAQFRFVAEHLARDPRHRVAAVGAAGARDLPGVRLERYPFNDVGHASVHPFARRFDREARRAEQVLYALNALDSAGFVPDVVVGHSGWGETLPLRAKYQKARFVAYCEFYYRDTGGDVHFDPEFPSLGVDGLTHLRAKNASQLVALADCDAGMSPTAWQRSTYPVEFQGKIAVAHEGVDTAAVRPDPSAAFRLPNGAVLRAGSEVLTYVARNLEPMRGFHVFMRALPEVLRRRPEAQVVIAGGHDVSYGATSPDGRSWKDVYLSEVAHRLDARRVHFLGSLPYADYLSLLQVSRAHVYLTYPFVLSWSLIEAMSAGCLIIGSDTAPLRDAITHGRDGLLVPFFDVDRLAGTISEALARPGAGLDLRQGARATALNRFDRRRALAAQLQVMMPPG
ncbi:Glycosyltransferase involved in cell wall bisynthesis [Methylobacterium sp. 174MFSha1.1]|uniref:glycosyltransferase n=1 Tax=Methylobacterium sp. 174MFSha1.1 TaxID=1502749 RepID=UPI0008E5D740|nr:glycosyltransferase [Methylobacterium sp. 174MFSha1.1]SFU46497.1 Glycosyltransferase involved in cell wall bisynthesis [Methylobacterium sp. 174MFSha1.1]